jgi:hypothetical protein
MKTRMSYVVDEHTNEAALDNTYLVAIKHPMSVYLVLLPREVSQSASFQLPGRSTNGSAC